MVFTHDTEMSLATTVALVNSWPGRFPDAGEGLPDLAALDRLVQTGRVTGSRTHDAAELEAVRALRPRLAELWYADDEDEVVEVVNGLLREFHALPRLVRHDEWGWHLHAYEGEAPLAHRIALDTAMAMVDVVRAGELSRLRMCAADDCGDVVIDLSKNRSRRYCDDGCGNRVNVAAYRARRARTAAPATAGRGT